MEPDEKVRTAIRADCAPLIAEARRNGAMLHTSYHDLWFTPDELEAAQAAGRFLWGAVNWRLRPKAEYVEQSARALASAAAEHNARLAKVG